jgi:hypothetical protein
MPLEGVPLSLTKGTPEQQSLSTLSDENGHYAFAHLLADTYRLEVRVEGFDPFAKTITLASDNVYVENVVLHLKAVVEKVDVQGKATSVATESAAPTAHLSNQQIQALPMAEQKFKAVLPLVPGVVRTHDGALSIKGQAENQGMLIVASARTVDPVTGGFSIPVPIDAVEKIHVEKAPFDSEFGGFSGGLTVIDVKPPSSSWHYGLMDFIPGVRGRAGHLVGIAAETPRLFFGGPLVKNKLNFAEAFTYDYVNHAIRGLAWPHNETRTQGFASLSTFQAILSSRHLLLGGVDVFSNRVRFANINSLVPQQASADDGQRGVAVGLHDSYQFSSGALLNTIFRYTRFDSNTHSQGPEDMLVTPDGWGGNFFNAWTRTSNQYEVLPLYQFPVMEGLGRHEVKVGGDITYRNYDGKSLSHPVQLLREDGSLAELIAFQGQGMLAAKATEGAEFVQDHWSLNEHLTLDLGGRLSSQSLGRAAAFAPRAGLAYSPGQGRNTVVRLGGGLFYDRVPLLAADFAHNPERVVTVFDGNGLPLGPPIGYQDVCLNEDRQSGSCPPSTSARNFTATAEVDRELARHMTLRVSYLFSQTRNLDVEGPLTGAAPLGSMLAVDGSGRSHYHEIETTLHYRPTDRDELNVSYLHSRGRGDLNTLSSIFVPFEQPVIRPDASANFASDVPNRLVAWGIFALPLPGKLTLSPVADVRTGFPYSNVDVFQNYVGIPNSQRFPTFFALDLKLYREFKVSSLPLLGRFKNQKLRFGVYSINLTGHNNYLDVYNNVTSPHFGHFAGMQHRVSGLVIDMVD